VQDWTVKEQGCVPVNGRRCAALQQKLHNYLLTYLFTSLRMGPFRFQARGRKM